jgi:hypothetical protein
MQKNRTQRLPDQDNRNTSPGPPKSKRTRPESVLNRQEKSEVTSPDEHNPENNEPSGEMRRSVTNHDEQNKATNNSVNDNPLDEKETEGV